MTTSRRSSALVPLFGPLEITIGDYTDVIDGHEPAELVDERPHADLMKRAQLLLGAMEDFGKHSRRFKPSSTTCRSSKKNGPAPTCSPPGS